jgi:hypothetical protein
MSEFPKYFVNCLFLDHNSAELHKNLEDMGYCGLHWTVCDEPDQCLIASSHEHIKNYLDGSKKLFAGSFWNSGVNQICRHSNCIDCGSDETKFLSLAKRLIVEKEFYLDKDGNEIEFKNR